ncbi:MAG: 60S ribosomal protein L26A [Cercozoa sp. M6MM]
MKYNKAATSDRTKQRKAHFQATSLQRRKIMSSTLSPELRKKYGVRSVPIRKGDTVMVMRGHYKGREGKVIQVYRKKYVVHVERVTTDKTNGATVPVGLHTSKLMITDLFLNKDRKALLARKGGAADADLD